MKDKHKDLKELGKQMQEEVKGIVEEAFEVTQNVAEKKIDEAQERLKKRWNFAYVLGKVKSAWAWLKGIKS